jgi:hypothetical protein
MYLKIVPATGVDSAMHFMECDHIDYRVEHGPAKVVREAVSQHTHPDADPDECRFKTVTVGYTRSVMDPLEHEIAAVLITAYADGKPLTLIGAYESRVFLMNDKGMTVDRIDATRKFD